MVVEPGIEGRQGFFQQDDAGKPRLLGGRHGEFAGHLIEGCGHGEHDQLLFEPTFLPAVSDDLIPGFAQVLQITGAGFHRGELGHVGRAPQGRMAAVRSTPAWQSQDLADETRWPGTSAPCSRANSPTA